MIVMNDLRFAIRVPPRGRAFGGRHLTLALGIGANTAIFGRQPVLLRPLPFDDPERLVLVLERYHNCPPSTSWPTTSSGATRAAFQSIAAMRPVAMTMTGQEPDRVPADGRRRG
jgi:hypothetical protein